MNEKSTDNNILQDNVKEKEAVPETNVTGEGSSGNSWIPNLAASWVNTAKEKTISTFEMMKKDINEFSDTLQHGANTLAGATVKQAHHLQHLIAPVPDTCNSDEQQENKTEMEETSKQTEEPNETSNQKSGIFSLGWMQQVVETVHKFATEDTVEDDCTEEFFVGTGGRKTILDQFTLLQMQNDPRTFTQAPQQNVDLYKEWLNDFKISEYNGEINILLSNNPRLREIYAELVPSQLDNNAFWNRYFFKVHLKELDKQISLAETPINLNKIDLKDSTKEGHSPAPSNGKDDWSMCSSGPAAEELDEENGREEETSTPKPEQKQDDEADDWEECIDDANVNKKNKD